MTNFMKRTACENPRERDVLMRILATQPAKRNVGVTEPPRRDSRQGHFVARSQLGIAQIAGGFLRRRDPKGRLWP
jgi:hypothetical protein